MVIPLTHKAGSCVHTEGITVQCIMKDTVVWEKFDVKNFCRWCDMTKIKHMKYF